jgi:hypothetical protein
MASDTDALNRALAEALAPLVGEAAVYTGRHICGNGHVKQQLPSGEWAHDASDVLEDGCGGAFDHIPEPVDFADPALGWLLWDQWADQTLPDVEVSYYEDYVFVELYTMRTSELGVGPALWPALLAAWAKTLAVNSDV